MELEPTALYPVVSKLLSQFPNIMQVRKPNIGSIKDKMAAIPATPVIKTPAVPTALSKPSEMVSSPEVEKIH